MNLNNNLKLTVMASLFLVLASAPNAQSADMAWPFIKREVVKRDVKGHIQVMQARTKHGVCIAEIVHARLAPPRIYVLLISRTRLQNLGFLLINDGTRNGRASDSALTERFGKAISQCLPFIVPGYVIV